MANQLTFTERNRQGLHTRLCRPKTQDKPCLALPNLLATGSSPCCPQSPPGHASPEQKQPGVGGCVAGTARGGGSCVQPPARRVPPGAGHRGQARVLPDCWSGPSGRLGLCVLAAGGSLSCCIDPRRGRNMCAMHRSMGRLKMRVHLPDDWGEICRWHWQHSEGQADLRSSPQGEARPLVELRGQLCHRLSSGDPVLLARHTPPQQSCVCCGRYTMLGSFWR